MHSQKTEIEDRLYNFSSDGHAELNNFWYYFDPDFDNALEGRARSIEVR